VRISADLPECLEFPLFSPTGDDGLPVRHRALYGGRGSAKSHGFARALLVRGFVKPERIYCFREIQKSIDGSVKTLLDDLIPQMGFGPTNGDGFYESLQYEIRAKNGTTVDFAGLRSNVESVKSTEGITIGYVNEARTVSQNSIKVLTPTIRAEGSEIWWDWNPDSDKDPVDLMFRGGTPPPGSIVRRVNYTENPWFGEPLKSEMEWDKARDPDKYAHVWLGEYSRNSEQRVFRNWRVEAFDTPREARFRFGADWGFAVDPTVLVRCYLDSRTLYVDHCVSEVGCEIDKTPALFDLVPDSRKWPITADSARPETVSYMRRQAFKIVSAIKGSGSIEDGVEFLKSFDIVVHPRCEPVIEELTLYSYKVDAQTGEVLPVLEDKHNNTIDALRYALEGLRKMGPAPVITANPNPPDLWGRPRREADTWRTA
jgi:phage terminase large subunit